MIRFFKPPEKKTMIAKVIKKQTLTMYIVQDTKNRKYQVESDGSYSVGQSVIVADGVIVGRTKSLDTFKEYVV